MQGPKHTFSVLMPIWEAEAALAAKSGKIRRFSWLEDADGKRIDDEPVVDAEVMDQGLMVTAGE